MCTVHTRVCVKVLDYSTLCSHWQQAKISDGPPVRLEPAAQGRGHHAAHAVRREQQNATQGDSKGVGGGGLLCLTNRNDFKEPCGLMQACPDCHFSLGLAFQK